MLISFTGYHVRPKDSTHFVRLFADAQFYSCKCFAAHTRYCFATNEPVPRFTSQLFESDIFIQIGDRDFQIPRDIFNSPGNTPNFFSLGFAAFFASPSEVFPGLDRKGLLRPPAIEPPRVPNRSGEVFADLLHMLRGYPLEIRNEEHRAALLRDCRYFHLRGLEQKLIPHHISYDAIEKHSEIVLSLEDVRQSGIEISPSMDNRPTPTDLKAWGAIYARPFTDSHPHELIVQTGADEAMIDSGTCRVRFFGATHEKMTSLLQLMVTKMNLPPNTPSALINNYRDFRLSVDIVDLTVNGERIDNVDRFCEEAGDLRDSSLARTADRPDSPPSKRRRMVRQLKGDRDWAVRTGQWSLGVVLTETGMVDVMIVAVKLDVYTKLNDRNRTRGFLR